MTDRTFEIAGRKIGAGQPPYIIAEMSGNHNGDINRAMRLLEAAHASGADAVKLQTYTADTMTIDVDRPDFRIQGGPWDGRILHDLYEEAHTPWEWHPALFSRARELGITAFSTPFDLTSVDFLRTLDAPAYKIASFELTDTPFVSKVAAEGKPMILSTGLAKLSEIEQAVVAVRCEGLNDFALLHCISAYPAPASDSNLATIPHLGAAFDCPAGLSDHTLGTEVAVASVALGATVIEKHFTLARSDGGPDAAFSLEPSELSALVRQTRTAWEAIGRPHYDLKGSERGSIVFRRSLYAIADIAEGETFSDENIRSIRPGHGLPPADINRVLGRQAKRAISRGEPLDWDLVR